MEPRFTGMRHWYPTRNREVVQNRWLAAETNDGDEAVASPLMSPAMSKAAPFDSASSRVSPRDLSPDTSVGPLDRLVQIAAQVERTPLAFVSMTQGSRPMLLAGSWGGASFGDLGEIPATHLYCQRVIDTGQPLAITEAEDCSPVVHDFVGPHFIVSYCGVPLRARGGQVIGSFCVGDVVARIWTDEDRKVLENLALAVLTELDTHRAHLQLEESSSAYRELLDITTELICVADSAGIITYVNRAWREAFGYASDHAVGRRAVDLVCPEHRSRFVDVARRLHGGEAIEGFEVVAVGKDERRIVCRGSATAIGLHLNGQFRCVSTRAVYQDVTAERRAQAERARLVATLEATTDFVGIAIAEGGIEYINRAGRHLIGIGETEDIGGLSAHHFHPPETLALLATEGFPAAVRNGFWKGEGFLLARDGESIPVSIAMTAHPSLSHEEPAFFSAIMRDRRQEVVAAAAVKQSEAQLALIYNHVSDLLCLLRVDFDAHGQITEFCCESVNDAVLASTSSHREDYLNKTLAEMVSPERHAELREHYVQTVRTGKPRSFEYTSHKTTPSIILETTLTAVMDLSGKCTHVLAASRDVTARRAAEAAEQRSEATFREMLQTVRAVAVILDATGRITFANDALLTLTGWRREHVLGKDWFARFVPQPDEVREVYARMMKGLELVLHYENEIITASGRIRLIVWDNTLLRNADGQIIGVASLGQDVTDQRALEGQLAELAQRDELTGLFNRRGFVEHVEVALTDLHWRKQQGAMLCIDLDRFKSINDTWGHAAGDDVLRNVSEVLRSVTGEATFAGRLGGDEFAVFVPNTEQNPASALCDRLHDELRQHNDAATLAGRPFSIALSVGVAEASGNVRYDQLAADADAALYRAKSQRK